ncbi:F-box/kelch-repeat protein At3g23880-like [Cornus florida]|uniref:F-box/kelch-repeat protein At3g23880-like n=1 Tax=Cornus florida TaxID=4283 RepID=UPI0028A1A8E3|nr:F-box/kelch-repeat protein At3g23880-like [Cornus florida]
MSVIQYDESFAQYFQPELPEHLKPLYIYGNCNGLVCLCDSPVIASRNIFLWNPALRILKTLPKPQIVEFGLPLASHSSSVAMGFDYRDNVYKVVMIVSPRPDMDNPYDNSSFLVEVYSLSTDSWRRIDVAAPSYCIHGCPPEFMRGVAYWTAYRKTKWNYVYTILQFEMADEVFKELLLPNGVQH